MSAHQGEPILAVFQQLYPRILLNKYGIKSSGDYPLIAYFAQEMAQSNALDFDLRTELLRLLSVHIPVNQYTELINSTLQSARSEARRRQGEITRLKALIALNPEKFSPSDPKTYLTASHRRVVAYYEQTTLSANIAQLVEWQKAINQ